MTDAQAVPLSRPLEVAPRPDQVLRGLAVAGLVLTLAAAAGLLYFAVTLPPDLAEQFNSTVAVSLLAVGMTGLAVAGTVLAWQQPRSVMAWLMLGTALAWTVGNVEFGVAWWLLGRDHDLAPVAGWVSNWVWIPSHVLSMIVLLRLPTGRLPGRRWRPVEWAVLVWAVLTGLTTALLPGPLGADVLSPLTNPLGWALLEGIADGLLSALFMVLPVLIIVSGAAPVVRWRRAGTRERGALRWVAGASVLVAIAAPLALVSEAGEILQGLASLLLPVGIGTAVLREQLWDLDLRRRYDRLRLARDQERERLRRELHDSLGPLLGSISMRAEAARNLLAAGTGTGSDPDRTARVDGLLDSIGSTTEGALAEVRRLIDDLGPDALSDHDLLPALQLQALAYADRFPVTVTADPDPLPPLEERAAATAYLVVAEAVRNAARHSGGTGAQVRLATTGDRLHGEVRDNGSGLGTSVAGVGRSGMATRLAEEGGRFSLEEADGGGVVVRFELPAAVR